MSKKILILYTSLGLGHKSIAENIGYWLEKSGYTVELFDAHKVQGGLLASWGAKVHDLLLRKAPFVWNWLHNTRWFITCTLPFRTWVARFNSDRVLELIRQSQPDLVISSHNTCSAIVSSLKRRGLYTGLFGVTFSDYFLHRYWLFNNVDFYLANTEEQKQEMVELGISEQIITVCGITLKEKVTTDAAATRQKLGIPAGNRVVLFSSGSQGIGLSEPVLRELVALSGVTVLVVCGKDLEMKQKLEAKFQNTCVLLLGYYTPMDDLYAISDVFVTKPGGLAVAESLRYRLPMVIFYVLPGGEPLNYQYLLKRGLILEPGKSLTETVKQELQTGHARAALAENSEISKILPDPAVLVSVVTNVLQGSADRLP